VKTLGLCGLGDGGACCVVTSLGALSWSLGFLSFLSASVASLMLLLFLLFIFNLLVRGSPHHYVSVWPFGFIYKAERKPVSRRRKKAKVCSFIHPAINGCITM
jgi:hypothetical protein